MFGRFYGSNKLMSLPVHFTSQPAEFLGRYPHLAHPAGTPGSEVNALLAVSFASHKDIFSRPAQDRRFLP